MIKTEIWNLALVEIGSVGNITDETDPSPEGQACRLAWTSALDQALAAYPWSCARREAKLMLRVDRPSVKYRYVYQLPPDCVAVRETIPGRVVYEVSAGNTLCSNTPKLAVVYTVRIDANAIASHVVPVVVAKLALHLATAMRAGGSSLVQTLGQRGELALSNARTIENRINFSRGRTPRWRERI